MSNKLECQNLPKRLAGFALAPLRGSIPSTRFIEKCKTSRSDHMLEVVSASIQNPPVMAQSNSAKHHSILIRSATYQGHLAVPRRNNWSHLGFVERGHQR